MRKKLFTAALLLGMSSMLCGFDQTETTESILQKQQEAIASAASISTVITVNADLAIDLAGAALTTATSGEITLDFIPDGPDFSLKGSIDFLSPLLAQENTYDFQLFLKTDASGSSDVYVYYANAVTGESYWDHDSTKGVDVSSLLSLTSSLDSEKLASLGIDFTLAPEAKKNDGSECYQLSAVLDSDSFAAAIDRASELSGQDLSADESLDSAIQLLDGLKLNLTYDIDTETFLPEAMHLDLNDSDLSVIEELVSSYLTAAMGSEEPLSIKITLNDASLDAVSSYNTVTEIIVPDEALAADASPDVIPDETEAQIISMLDAAAEAATE